MAEGRCLGCLRTQSWTERASGWGLGCQTRGSKREFDYTVPLVEAVCTSITRDNGDRPVLDAKPPPMIHHMLEQCVTHTV